MWGDKYADGYSLTYSLLAQTDTYLVRAGGSWTSPSASVLDNDYVDPYATVSLVYGPTRGTLSLAPNGTFTYAPSA
ncbi:Ig-like domain-containing protein, partial [Acinetobacter baumannii]